MKSPRLAGVASVEGLPVTVTQTAPSGGATVTVAAPDITSFCAAAHRVEQRALQQLQTQKIMPEEQLPGESSPPM